jgi:hypothetical protein
MAHKDPFKRLGRAWRRIVLQAAFEQKHFAPM